MVQSKFNASGAAQSSTLAVEDVVMSLQQLSKRITELETKIDALGQLMKKGADDSPGGDELQEDDSPSDALASYILDERLYRRIVSACRFCRTPRDVRNRVLNLLKQAGILDEWTINSKEFMDALLEHLVNLKNIENGADLLSRFRHHKK